MTQVYFAILSSRISGCEMIAMSYSEAKFSRKVKQFPCLESPNIALVVRVS